jgi:hypothetical protein
MNQTPQILMSRHGNADEKIKEIGFEPSAFMTKISELRAALVRSQRQPGSLVTLRKQMNYLISVAGVSRKFDGGAGAHGGSASPLIWDSCMGLPITRI